MVVFKSRHNLCPGVDTLISGSEDATVRVWDLRCGQARRVLRQDDAITCLALAPAVAISSGGGGGGGGGLARDEELIIFGDKTGKLSYLDVEER